MLVTVVVTFSCSNPSTWTLGTDALTDRPGAAETATAQATRVTREARRGEKNMVVKTVKGVEETTRMNERGLSSFSVLVNEIWRANCDETRSDGYVAPKANMVDSEF